MASTKLKKRYRIEKDQEVAIKDISQLNSEVSGFSRDEDYAFVGWSRDPLATTPEFGGVGQPITATFDRTTELYAIWDYQYCFVNFDPQGGECENSDTIKIARGQALGEFLTQINVTLDGYKFNGWFTLPTGGEAISSHTRINNNMTVYAHYVEDLTYTPVTPGPGDIQEPEEPDPGPEVPGPEQPPVSNRPQLCELDESKLRVEQATCKLFTKWYSPEGVGKVYYKSGSTSSSCPTFGYGYYSSAKYTHKDTGKIYYKVDILPWKDLTDGGKVQATKQYTWQGQGYSLARWFVTKKGDRTGTSLETGNCERGAGLKQDLLSSLVNGVRGSDGVTSFLNPNGTSAIPMYLNWTDYGGNYGLNGETWPAFYFFADRYPY